MKRIIVLCLLAAFLLCGCTTTGFLGFLATTEYVNTKTAEVNAKAKSALDEQAATLVQVRTDLEEVKALREEAQKSIAMVADTQKAIEELRALSVAIEERIAAMPAETLQKLVEILQTFLDQEAAQ